MPAYPFAVSMYPPFLVLLLLPRTPPHSIPEPIQGHLGRKPPPLDIRQWQLEDA